jgi:uncharacterized protein (DUF1810 family)
VTYGSGVLWSGGVGVSDPFDLERFVAAQAQIYTRVVAELSEGRKRSHWMWFIFPQIEGLGSSGMAQRFAIGSRPEAAPILLTACSDRA